MVSGSLLPDSGASIDGAVAADGRLSGVDCGTHASRAQLILLHHNRTETSSRHAAVDPRRNRSQTTSGDPLMTSRLDELPNWTAEALVVEGEVVTATASNNWEQLEFGR